MIEKLLFVVWLHFLADFILQTDNVAKSKSSSWYYLTVHAVVYSIPFFLIGWKYALINAGLHLCVDAVIALEMHKALYCHFDREGYDKRDVDKILRAGLRSAVDKATIKTSDEGTSYCTVCEQRARTVEETHRENYLLLRKDIPLIIREAKSEALEEAAKVCEQNDEVTELLTGSRKLEPKTTNNLNGLAYSKAIRALKEKL